MSHTENEIFNKITKSTMYGRYIGDIFILTKILNDIKQSKEIIERNSVFNFTY